MLPTNFMPKPYREKLKILVIKTKCSSWMVNSMMNHHPTVVPEWRSKCIHIHRAWPTKGFANFGTILIRILDFILHNRSWHRQELYTMHKIWHLCIQSPSALSVNKYFDITYSSKMKALLYIFEIHALWVTWQIFHLQERELAEFAKLHFRVRFLWNVEL